MDAIPLDAAVCANVATFAVSLLALHMWLCHRESEASEGSHREAGDRDLDLG